MSKVVCVLGSPRPEGNSATLAMRVAEAARAGGAEVRAFRLYELQFRGCIACMACKKGAERCVIQDDLTPVLEAVREADLLVLASPIYFGQVTGEFKSFLDRTYSFLTPEYITSTTNRSRLTPGRKCVMVLTQGNPDAEQFAGVYPPYATFWGPDWLGYDVHLLRGLGMRAPTDAAGNEALLQEAEELGRRLMG